MSRRKLPAPPLVLQPVFVRVRQGSPRAGLLLELARFLKLRGMLTDGGALNLERGLQGRGGTLSLTTQDVRSWAHGLVVELWEAPPGEWPEVQQDYGERFDRGKPRRPNRLQRLFQEWSSDFGPLGLLRACRTHPRLWETIELVLESPAVSGTEAELLKAVDSLHRRGDWEGFQASYRAKPKLRRQLLLALPLVDAPDLPERLAWLSQELKHSPELGSEILQACRPHDPVELSLPDALAQACLQLLREHPGQADPKWLGSLRHYRWPQDLPNELDGLIAPHDSIRHIVFGARPGTNWLNELLSSLRD